jgi:hypothetical protein
MRLGKQQKNPSKTMKTNFGSTTDLQLQATKH